LCYNSGDWIVLASSSQFVDQYSSVEIQDPKNAVPNGTLQEEDAMTKRLVAVLVAVFAFLASSAMFAQSPESNLATLNQNDDATSSSLTPPSDLRTEDVINMMLSTRNAWFTYNPQVTTVHAMTLASTGKHRAVGKPSTPPKVQPFKAAIDEEVAKDGTRTCDSWFYIFTHLDVGDTIQPRIWAPDGTLWSDGIITISTVTPEDSPWPWQGPMLRGTIPLEWGDAPATFEAIVTKKSHKYVVSTKVSTGSAHFGPLVSAHFDAQQGVLLDGVFMTATVVMNPLTSKILPTAEGGNYILPVVNEGTIVTVCSGVGGNPDNLECTTTVPSK
jgi:hypothetical protein